VTGQATQWEIPVPMTMDELANSEADGSFYFGLYRETVNVEIVARYTIDGEPASKSRARWSPKTGRAYTPEGTRIAEQRVGWGFRQVAGTHKPQSQDTYGVLAGFFCGTGQRRDVDNMLKLILDGLNKIAWADDSQVTEVSGRLARYVHDPRTEIVVYRTLTHPRPTRACEHCGTPFELFPSQNTGTTRRRFCSRKCANAAVEARNQRSCRHCGKTFQSSRKDVLYCSTTCAYTGKHIELTCLHCGNTFTMARSLAPRNKALCSQECRTSYWREHRKTGAKGTCVDCSGPTSKKSYVRCQACAVVHGSMRRTNS
jgi:Holliday junction resolvase RusA-like endonuclease